VRVKATEMLETCSVIVTLRGSIAQQVQKMHDSDRLKNRAEIKCLLHYTHFLAHQYIAHATNFCGSSGKLWG